MKRAEIFMFIWSLKMGDVLILSITVIYFTRNLRKAGIIKHILIKSTLISDLQQHATLHDPQLTFLEVGHILFHDLS